MDESFEGLVDRAGETLRRLVREHPGHPFRVGRCAAEDLKRVFGTAEFASARLVRVLARGSRSESDLLERILIRRSLREFGGACLNSVAGNGEFPTAPAQLVYLVIRACGIQGPARRVA